MADQRRTPEQTPIGRFRAARHDPALVVLEGFHPLKHALRFGAAIELACAPDLERLSGLARRVAADVEEDLRQCVRAVSPTVFDQLAPVAPATGVIAIAKRPEFDVAAALRRPEPVILLDRPSHLGNVGATIRVAAAAGAAAVLTTGRHDPWHPVAVRGSAGLHYAVPVAHVGELPAGDRPLLAMHPGGEPLGPGTRLAGAVLAFGSERYGLGSPILDAADRQIAIPMEPGVSSLNLATAVAVVLYAWRLAGATGSGPARAPLTARD